MLNQTLKDQINVIAARYPKRSGALLPAIHLVQDAQGGYVSHELIKDIAGFLGVPKSMAFGVQSYYTMFNLKPVGRYHLQLDTNIPAMLAGAKEILTHLQNRLGICVGETTADGLFTLSEVEDLASCGTCPVLQVNDRYYEGLTTARVDELLDLLRQDIMPDWPVETSWSSTCNILMKRRAGSATGYADYVSTGGYLGLSKALTTSAEDLRAMVKHAGLRGRGGAGFPLGIKMGFVPQNGTKPVYLVCNADEGEPGTFKDRQIMEHDPHLLIEGMIIAARAVSATLGFIYIRGEFAWIGKILEKAVDEAREAGILGTGFDIIVHLGAGAYVCGEETALIESLEGKRGNPRLKPPFPAIEGLWGCPTLVSNVETLANLPWILENGAEAYRGIGGPEFGPKIYGVCGHVNKPGVFEMPMGALFEDVIKAAGGISGNLKAVIVGGLSAPVLTAEEIKGLKLNFESCQKAGTMFGSGGMIVMNDTASIPDIALRTARFYSHESCGQCIPCRQGSHVICKLLAKIVAKQGSMADIETIERLCATIPGTTLCPTGEAFAKPLGAMVKKFRPEFEALVK